MHNEKMPLIKYIKLIKINEKIKSIYQQIDFFFYYYFPKFLNQDRKLQFISIHHKYIQ